MPLALLDMALPSPVASLRATVLATLVCLGGCVSDSKFAPSCPASAFVPGAADLTLYRPGGRDLTDLVLDAKITGVNGECSRKGPGMVTATLKVGFAATRGPAATGRNVVLHYFVAVTDATRVLDEQDYQAGLAFPPNTDTAGTGSPDITLNIPVTPEKPADAYNIFVGFRLTPEQLAANRARNSR